MRASRIAVTVCVLCAVPFAAAGADDAVPGRFLLRHPDRESFVDLPVYEIDQAIDDVTGTYSGRLTLHCTNHAGAPLSSIPLFLHPNAARELGATEGGSGSLSVVEVSTLEGPAATFESPRPSLVLVRLARSLAPGERIALRVRYQGRLRRLDARVNDAFGQALSSMGGMAGAGAADYGLLATGDGIVTMGSAYPMLAPFRDGRFDVTAPCRIGDLAYNAVAAFRVRSIVPAGFEIVTNLADGAPEEGPEGSRIVVSEGALVRDFVLVGGRDLAREERLVDGVRVSSVFRAKDARAGKIVLAAAAAALSSYERRFGPYPYVELDVVESSLTGGAGGVEFGALVLIAGMLYRSTDDSTSPLAMLLKMWGNLGGALDDMDGQKGTLPEKGADEGMLDPQLVFTVAHEVAHQWFAGIVGNDSRRHPSLDEPLAQYAAGLAVEDQAGEEAAARAMDGNVKLNYALYRLLDGQDRSVLRDTATFRSAIEYAGLVYGKAPYLYVSLARSLGEDRLHGAIRSAVERYRFRIASTEEWTLALDSSAGEGSGVRDAFRRWLEEAHGDEDLSLDDSGDFVMDAMFPPDVAANLRAALPALGMKPKDFLKMAFGGGLGDDAPLGPGIDPEEALEGLDKKGR